jgi:hypothetical protein
MAIDPLNLPGAAGLDFAEGDVRHLALGDEMSATSIGGSTRQLAERDNLIKDKLNEVVAVVNNKEQYVNLPTIRTILPPLAEEVIANHRIPPGFEARVLNAAVSGNPSGSGRLEIFYSTGFGASSGESLVSTLGEFTGETTFHGSGELIIKLTNIGSTSSEIVASIILTTRPIGEQFGAIIGAGTKGDPGDPGQKGDKGDKGDGGGSGPQGTPGMTWRGPWTTLNTYATNDGVSFSSGTLTSGYISTAPNTGTSPAILGGPWDLFSSGIQGPVGATGSGPGFASRTVNGTIFTHADYVSGAGQGSYQALTGGTYTIPFNEVVMRGGTDVTARGIAQSFTTRLADFRGTVTVLLPRIVDGAEVDYQEANTMHAITSHGSNVTQNVFVQRVSPRGFTINVPAAQPTKMSMMFHSMMPIV